jgi:REP element-mobilizing transposase RayT
VLPHGSEFLQGTRVVVDKPGKMTLPRYIIAGRTCFITARAVRRMFLFLPERDVVQVFEYLLAVAASKFGVHIHEALCMSNHFHILLTDVEGRVPDFMNFFDALLARSVNAIRGTSGTVFEEEYGLVAETCEDKIVAHAVYTLANPCAGHLVKRTRQWPGFSTLRMEYGQTVTIERPKVGLWKEEEQSGGQARKRGREDRRGKSSRLPEVVDFTLERPPVWMEMSDGEVRAEILRRLDQREIELIEQRRREGRDVVGRKGVLAQRWDGSPRQAEELFGVQPRVAGRVWRAALRQLRGFVDAYRNARERFLEGQRGVVWPFGTWAMRVRFGLPCEMAPP